MLWEGKSDYELAQEFIEVVEDAIRKSALNPLSKEEFKEEQKKEEKIIQEKAKEFIQNEQVNSINIERNEEEKKIKRKGTYYELFNCRYIKLPNK